MSSVAFNKIIPFWQNFVFDDIPCAHTFKEWVTYFFCLIDTSVDCGTSRGAITKAKKVVNQAFEMNDTIDYLFIWHLDYDHMSLVNTLTESVNKKVRIIVLPLVYKEEVRIPIGINYIANHQEAEVFLRRILDIGGGNNNGFDAHISFVGSNDDKRNANARDMMEIMMRR